MSNLAVYCMVHYMPPQVAALENSKSSLESHLQSAKSMAVRAQKRFSIVHDKVDIVLELENANERVTARDERIEQLSQALGERDEELRRQRREMSTLVTALELRAEELGLPDDFSSGAPRSSSLRGAARGAAHTLRSALLLEAAKWREAAAAERQRLSNLQEEHGELQTQLAALQVRLKGASAAREAALQAAADAKATVSSSCAAEQQQRAAAAQAAHERDAALEYIEQQKRELAAAQAAAQRAASAAAAARQEAATAVGTSTQARGKVAQVELVQRSTHEALQRAQRRAVDAEEALRRSEAAVADAQRQLQNATSTAAQLQTELQGTQQRCSQVQQELDRVRSQCARLEERDAAERSAAADQAGEAQRSAASASKQLRVTEHLLKKEQAARRTAEQRAQQAAVEAARSRDEARELQQLLEGSRMAKAVAVTQLAATLRGQEGARQTGGAGRRERSFQHTRVHEGSRKAAHPPLPPSSGEGQHGVSSDSSDDDGGDQLAANAASTARRMVREAINRSMGGGASR